MFTSKTMTLDVRSVVSGENIFAGQFAEPDAEEKLAQGKNEHVGPGESFSVDLIGCSGR